MPSLRVFRPVRVLAPLGHAAAGRVSRLLRSPTSVFTRLNKDLADVSASGLASSTRVVFYDSHVAFFQE